MQNNYETNFKRLEEIVNLLQQENVDIDTSIALFKEAIELKKQCETKLKEANKQIVTILAENGEEVNYENL